MNWLEGIDTKISIFAFIIFFLVTSIIVELNVYGFNLPFILVTLMMISANIIAIFLYSSHKLIAFITGLFSFIFAVSLQYLITGRMLIFSRRIGIIFIIYFNYFIYKELFPKSKIKK